MAYFFSGWILYSYIALFFVLAALLKFKFKKDYTYLLFFSIMYIYLYNIINLTQFPIYVDEFQKEVLGGQNVWKDMNLIPFSSGFSKTSLMNIIMTIPLGFGLPFLMKTSLKRILLIGLLAGGILELGQLSSALYAGYTFRLVDIDDLIYNFVGTLIGYLLVFKLFKLFFVFLINKLNIKSNSIINHINDAV
ncbi:MAG: VanZ family protein [Bacillota bacterium]